MSLRVVLVLALAVASAYGERVTCREVKGSNGQVSFDCVSAVNSQDLAAKNEYILWLTSNAQGKAHDLNIDVPNYQIQDTIQAAAKGAAANSHTNVNVNLAKPEVTFIAQKEERLGDHTQTFDVNLEYSKIQGQSVHFADEGAGSQRYSALQGRIEEPSGSTSSFNTGSTGSSVRSQSSRQTVTGGNVNVNVNRNTNTNTGSRTVVV
jgi:hypothetical protein